ncbi:transporter substrate-binding domain-containing diguanylate cyclase [Desulforhopalus sp. 52FAK]
MQYYTSLQSFFSLCIQTILILLFTISHANAIELTSAEQAYIDQHNTIKVHNETDWPPFNFNSAGQAQGISIDVMNRIADITGLQIEYITGPSWDTFMQLMGSDQLDVMLNIIDLPERREKLQFTTPYAKSLTGVFTNSQDSRNYFDFNDLRNKTIAVPAGFDLEINLPKYHPEVKVLAVRDILECIAAVHSGKADAFMEEIGVVDYIISQQMVSDVRLAFQVNEEAFISNLTIATSQDNDILHTIIQKGLNAISGDELNKIRKKWLLQVHEIYEQSMVNLTVPEKEYLFKNKTIDICVDPSWPPLDFINDQGEHSGLSSDLINTISRRLGTSLNLIPTKTWEQSLEFIKAGQCDIIPLMNETEESRSYIDFTQPYFKFATVIATRNEASFIGDYSQLYGKKVALQSYFFITEYVREHHPQIQIVEVENTREALKLVSEQKVFATIDGLPTIVNTIEALALENVKIVGSVPQENKMKLGVRKGNTLLLTIFNKGLNSLSEKEKIGLYKKWFDIEVANQFFNRSFIINLALGFSCILALLLWRQFTLSKYTQKLKTLNKKLHYSSTVDHLTKISNRKSIEKHLATEIERTKITNDPLSVVIFDIDHFKSVNDAFGHLTGDSVLQQMAFLVKSSIRKSDHFGRWGGEEFLIILPNTTAGDAGKLIQNLKKRIERYDFGVQRVVTASFGIGQYDSSETSTLLLSRIDDCLYQAKAQGRNRIVNAKTD